jgi:hypothetical protein
MKHVQTYHYCSKLYMSRTSLEGARPPSTPTAPLMGVKGVEGGLAPSDLEIESELFKYYSWTNTFQE